MFRWLTCVKYHPPPAPGYTPGTSVRMSVSEGTKFERNGSMMHTMVESLADETSYCPPPSNVMMHRGFARVKEQENAL